MFTVEAHFHGFKCHHAVDGEMWAVITQEFDVVQLRQPIIVIDHFRVGFAVTVGDVFFENFADAVDVCVDAIFVQHFAAFVFAGWVADLCRATAHEGYGFMAAGLEPV